jgi:hypothetical protein
MTMTTTWPRLLLPAFLVALSMLVGVAPGSAQAPPLPPAPTWGEAELEVLAAVQRLFEGMRARDGATVAAAFHPEARLQSALVDSSGAVSVRPTAIEGFAAAVGAGGEPWNERIVQAEVRIDGPMAHVWVPYTFHAGDRFSHCGVNSVQLVRLQEGWKILSLVDTRQREGCPAG